MDLQILLENKYDLKFLIVTIKRVHVTFVDYLNGLYEWFTKYNISYNHVHEDKLTDTLISQYTYVINVAGCIVNSVNKDNKSKIIILNTEQHSKINRLAISKIYLTSGLKILDYSLSNIAILNKETDYKYEKDIFYLPYLYNSNDNILFNDIKTKDICFIGVLTEYRKKIIDELRKEINIDIIDAWDEKRDNQLKEYKIILNIHANNDYQIFESFRCYRCIFNKILVVSQEKVYKDELDIENFCIFTKDHDLINNLNKTLNNYNILIKEKYSKETIDNYIEWSKNRFESFLNTLLN